MAWIDKREKGYLVRWREPGGKVVSKKLRTFDEARAFKADIESSLLKGSYVAQEARKLPFGQYAKLVLDADRGLAQATRVNYDTCLRLQLAPLAYIPIEHVDASRVRALFGSLGASGASGHTLHMTRKVLSKICSAAVEDGILSRNPAKAVKVPKQERRKVQPMTPEQVSETASAVPPRWRSAVLLAGWGGLRIGEIGALNKDDVDWERGSVRISKSQGRYGLKEAKTKSSNRVVTLPGWVMKELAAHSLEFAGPKGELFLTEYGNPITAMTMGPIMVKASAEMGRKVKFHDLRHTQAALLIKAGAHPRAIMERMGHSSIIQTMETYGHLFPGAHDALARTLEQYEPEDLGKVIELDR